MKRGLGALKVENGIDITKIIASTRRRLNFGELKTRKKKKMVCAEVKKN